MEEMDISAESRISDSLSVEMPATNDGCKKTKFEENSLVFAKLSGHSDPPWPARVVNLSWNNGTHCGYEVFFYGTYQVGKVLANKVCKYNENSLAKYSEPNLASVRKRTDFLRGLGEIRDCPDIASSEDFPQSASEIVKKCIGRTANEEHLKLQSQTNDVNTDSLSTCNPRRKKTKEGEIGMNWESSSVMTGIKKVGGKLKPSSWILEDSNKKSMQDAFTFEDEDYDQRSCISEPARRSTRTRQQPYWMRLEAMEMAARQTDEPTRIRQNKGVKSRASYRKTTPVVSSTIQGTRIADGNKVKINGQKSDKKETKNTFVVSPSASRSKNDLTRAHIFTTPNSSASSKEISPRPLMRSQGTQHQPARLPGTDADSTENEEAPQNSNPVVRMGLKTATMKPGNKSDITECVIVKVEPASENPRDWTVAQTIAAIIRTEPDISPEDIKAIRDHKINGKTLLKLSVNELVKLGKMKLGPAKMLSSLVELWNTKSQEFQ